MSADKGRRLGRGLEALLAARSSTPAQERSDDSSLLSLPIAEISPNPYQPRKEFRPEELAELEASLRTNGLLQPITVRRSRKGGGFELIAGERRLRAAARLGWTHIPALVREIDDRTLLTLAMVENLQRTDLNPIEEAEGYNRLIGDFHLTQQQVAELVGKERSTIANILRLLNLPVRVRTFVQAGQLSLGHARALLAIDEEGQLIALAQEVIANGLSVREVERRAQGRVKHIEPTSSRKTTSPASRPAEIRRTEDDLRRYLQTDVSIKLGNDEHGEISISFYSAEDLDRILDLVLGFQRERS